MYLEKKTQSSDCLILTACQAICGLLILYQEVRESRSMYVYIYICVVISDFCGRGGEGFIQL